MMNVVLIPLEYCSDRPLYIPSIFWYTEESLLANEFMIKLHDKLVVEIHQKR